MVQKFNINDTVVTRLPIRASMSDGAMLRGFRFQSENQPGGRRKKAAPLTTPLLCLATDLGNGKEHHRFALSMASQDDAAQRIYTIDLRGRGLSDPDGVEASDLASDADDLISFCDAHNLHHIDVVVSGFSAFILLLAATKRPGMVRRLVLNDASAEFDAVGIARRNALVQRAGHPANWELGAEQMKEMKSEEFPYFADADWMDLARQKWRDLDGRPVVDIAKGLVRWSNLGDFDNEQPSLWPQFAIFRDRPVLMVRGEFSGLVTGDIAAKTAAHHPGLRVMVAKGQGHVPQLERGHLTEHVLKFLGET